MKGREVSSFVFKDRKLLASKIILPDSSSLFKHTLKTLKKEKKMFGWRVGSMVMSQLKSWLLPTVVKGKLALCVRTIYLRFLFFLLQHNNLFIVV